MVTRATALVLVVAALIAVDTVPVDAFARFGRWDATTSSVFPVVRAYSCPNQFAQFFTQPWNAIRVQALAAFNEWFVAGGVDLRVRMQQDLPATDSRCAPGANPNSGEILVTAERNNGNGQCFLATTFWWTYGARIVGAKVIMHSGTVCSGTYTAHPWAATADYPGSGEYDFRSAFMHEFGHAIGFGHSTVSGSVMTTPAPKGDAQLRFLANDDREGLRAAPQAYDPAELRLKHLRSTDDGATWSSEGEPPMSALPAIGGPAVCYRNSPPSPLLEYMVAVTAAQGFIAPNNVVRTFTAKATANAGLIEHADAETLFAPALACSPTRYVMAYVAKDNAQTIWTKFSNDGITWSASNPVEPFFPIFQGAVSTDLPPTLAYSANTGWFVLAFAKRRTGVINMIVSTDGGVTFNYAQQLFIPSFRASSAIGLACSDIMASCTLSWADGNFSYTPLTAASLQFFSYLGNVLPVFSTTSIDNLGYNSYGGGASANSTRTQFAWRDRGGNTVLVSGGWTAPPTLNPVTFVLSDTTHSPPAIAWGSKWSEWAAWFLHHPIYDQATP